ncbi:protein rep, partial [Campylobacter jejuni]|uniref:protein rep n=1 Tax=Campylobacter jejuni TaxID=197 RepID=UPI000A8D1110
MKNPELQNLTDYSPSDAPWDAHRSVSDDVGGIYLLAAEYERYGARMALCGGLLRFGWSTLKETGETRLRLREAHFCRVRHCPVCQWRRSLMWQARFYQSLPRIVADYPDARWVCHFFTSDAPDDHPPLVVLSPRAPPLQYYYVQYTLCLLHIVVRPQ